jgi:hypothetical protein
MILSKSNIATIIISIILVSISSFSCSAPTTNEVKLGQEFTLPFGQSARIAGENIKIKFVDVISDSRCPQGVTCIWAGEASSLIEITASDKAYSKVLTQSGHSENTQTGFEQYLFTCSLLPYPQAGKETIKKDYHLQLLVSKQ